MDPLCRSKQTDTIPGTKSNCKILYIDICIIFISIFNLIARASTSLYCFCLTPFSTVSWPAFTNGGAALGGDWRDPGLRRCQPGLRVRKPKLEGPLSGVNIFFFF